MIPAPTAGIFGIVGLVQLLPQRWSAASIRRQTSKNVGWSRVAQARWPMVLLRSLLAMKRLRKVTQWVLVWVSIGLLSVDPASACRLLANRRCRCCCPCPPVDCPPVDCGGEMNGATPEASPSDMPPFAQTEAGQLPEAPAAAPSPSVGPTRPIATEAAEPRNAAPPIIIDVRPLTPAAINPAAPVITEPATVPAVAGQSAPR